MHTLQNYFLFIQARNRNNDLYVISCKCIPLNSDKVSRTIHRQTREIFYCDIASLRHVSSRAMFCIGSLIRMQVPPAAIPLAVCLGYVRLSSATLSQAAHKERLPVESGDYLEAQVSSLKPSPIVYF